MNEKILDTIRMRMGYQVPVPGDPALNPPHPGATADLRLHWSQPLNPPSEPEMTFEEWYGELRTRITWLIQAAVKSGERARGPDVDEVEAALLAHARKRIRP